MAMVVKNNLGAVRTVNTLEKNTKAQGKSLAKTSSGMKINSAEDDASGYAISERMRVRIRALDQANQNAQNDSALMKTAGGAVDNTVELLRALKEKAINAANDSNTDEDRLIIQKEAHQLIDQINDNALVQFNGKYLIDGTKNNAIQTTRSIFLNDNLVLEGTGSGILGTTMVHLKNRVGDSLGIQNGDSFSVSYVINGKTTVKTGSIDNSTTLAWLARGGAGPDAGSDINPYRGVANTYKNKFGEVITLADGYEHSLAISSSTTAVVHENYVNTSNQITGYTISIMDAQGNVRKSANANLEFKLVQRAENATGDNSLNFHVGSEANVAIKVALTDMRAHALGLQGNQGEKILLVPKENANAAINVFNNALEMALDQATSIGAVQQRLEYTQTNLTTSSENVQAAESTIRDADMAKEMTEYTKNNVLTQAAQAMLAQANQTSSAVISLLQ